MSLGSIVVRLTMNTADFETDAGRAARVADRRAKEIDQAFRKAGVAIGLALAGAIVGVVSSVKGAIDSMDELSKASQRVGLPTEDFSRLAYAGSLADVSVDTLVSTMGKLTKAQAAALKDTSQQAKVFDALGISVKNVDGSLRDSNAVLLEFADRFADLQGSPEAMAAGFAIFGRSFQDMIPLIKDGSGAMREMFEESDRLGVTLSTDAGKAAEEFNDNLTRLQTSVKGVWMEMAGDLLPALNDVTGAMVSSAGASDSLANSIGTVLAGQVRAARTDFEFFAKTLQDIYGYLQQVSLAVESTKRSSAALGSLLMFDIDGFREQTSAAKGFREEMDRIGELRRSGLTQKQVSEGFAAGFDLGLPGSKRSPVLPIKVALVPDFNFANDRVGSFDPAKLRNALGGGDPKKSGGGKTRKAELTDEQKALADLQRQYESLMGSMTDRIGLFGAETEVAKVTYETQMGSLKLLDEAKKQSLLTKAAEIDALQAERELHEDAKRLVADLLEPYERVNQAREEAAKLLAAGAIAQEDYNRAVAAHRTPAEQMIANLEHEILLLGKTREEQERLNLARALGGEVATDAGQKAIGKLKEYQEADREMAARIEGLDAVRDSFRGLAKDIAAGVEPLDALKNAFANLAAKISEMALDRIIEGLFGAPGTGGGGAFGDLIGGVFGALFGGPRAYGGPVADSRPYMVGERGPEMFIPNTAGRIVPTQALQGGRERTIVKQPIVAIGDRAVADAMAGAAGRDVILSVVESNWDRFRGRDRF